MSFEPIIDLDDWFDGPREGVASFRGAPWKFKSRCHDVFEHRGDFESVDIFELTPVGAPEGTAPLLATVQFRGQSDPAVSPAFLEAEWFVIE